MYRLEEILRTLTPPRYRCYTPKARAARSRKTRSANHDPGGREKRDGTNLYYGQTRRRGTPFGRRDHSTLRDARAAPGRSETVAAGPRVGRGALCRASRTALLRRTGVVHHVGARRRD